MFFDKPITLCSYFNPRGQKKVFFNWSEFNWIELNSKEGSYWSFHSSLPLLHYNSLLNRVVALRLVYIVQNCFSRHCLNCELFNWQAAVWAIMHQWKWINVAHIRDGCFIWFWKPYSITSSYNLSQDKKTILSCLTLYFQITKCVFIFFICFFFFFYPKKHENLLIPLKHTHSWYMVFPSYRLNYLMLEFYKA